ncbi:NAD(P)H-binding protein [Nocardioides dongxiaopingii]|uniref:NAD(P)H-binding protein n=1 Tax=Nocardioides dongxiaopingii TaxID=2576036 RepID=UPI0010C76DB4|nr:NAD(P)H-binding protein [Nocardioides dongxiaopingii]
MEPLEVAPAPGAGLRWLTGMALAFTTFMVFLAVGCLGALLTRDLDGPQVMSALVVGVVGALGTTAGLRGVRALRAAAHPVVALRLDADGVHLHEGAGIPDLPDDVAWTTLPWPWIASVTHTSFDLAASKRLGADMALDCLRFALVDDDLLDQPRFESPTSTVLAEWLGLTPRQVRATLLGEKGAVEHQQVLAWLRRHRPDLAVLTGATAPWSTRASADRWPDSPRVAVVGAHGRLGRRVVEALARREPAPPIAVVRNEAHRAPLERLGAEVRMLDLEAQGVGAIASTLRGCAAVVHVATPSPAHVVEGALRAGVQRLVVVPGGWDGDEQVAVAARSGLAWTAFRPSALTDLPASGEVDLGLDVTPGPVSRADLAEVVAASIRDEDSVGAAWAITGVAPPR